MDRDFFLDARRAIPPAPSLQDAVVELVRGLPPLAGEGIGLDKAKVIRPRREKGPDEPTHPGRLEHTDCHC